jgi:hypothetical protein
MSNSVASVPELFNIPTILKNSGYETTSYEWSENILEEKIKRSSPSSPILTDFVAKLDSS